jgi:hypothetical protein
MSPKSLVVLAALSCVAAPALAVPSFARQTGMSCSQCHTSFPELTSFGRAFKATGYTLSTTKSVTDTNNDKSVLELIGMPPLAVMLQAGYTHTKQPQQLADARPSAKNDDFLLPQQLSLFYAGKIAPKVGGFIQLTYSGQDDKLGLDNTDIRYADTVSIAGTDLIYGVTLNNNPSVSDLWHGTPAWGFPFVSSDAAPGAAAATLINGGLAGQVAGASVYGYWNNTVYAEIAAYHAAPLGVLRPLEGTSASPASNVIDGFAPYWRVAAQKEFGAHSVEIGTYGLAASVLPGAGGATPAPLTGPTNHFVDVAGDVQYQFVGERHVASIIGAWIHEAQRLDAAALAGDSGFVLHSLDEQRVSASYLYDRWIGCRLSWFGVDGTPDGTIFAPGHIVGSATGGPKTQALQGEIIFNPWLNTRLGVQYTGYVAFNGGTSNYDGSGRAASDNNSLYVFAWLVF